LGFVICLTVPIVFVFANQMTTNLWTLIFLFAADAYLLNKPGEKPSFYEYL
jgi:hypothetical protein